MDIKSAIRPLVPPVLYEAAHNLKRRAAVLSGSINGYEHPELVEEIFRKTAVYDPSGNWPEMASASSVLDFGGGCGQHYKLARKGNPAVRWAIVETPAMAARAAAELATDRLQFFTSIAEAKNWLVSIDIMHSNGALQYTPNPEETLRDLCSVDAAEMHWSRVALSGATMQRERQFSLLGENGPGAGQSNGKAVRYLRTLIPEQTFLAAHCHYALTARGPDWFRFARAS